MAFLGPRDYSMRIWLDPQKLAFRGMTVGDVINAISEQNIQVAAGRIGQSPVPEGTNLPFQLTVNTQGRIESAEKFGKIIVKTGEQGQNVYLKDVVRETKYGPNGQVLEEGVELGAKNYDVNSYLDGKPAVTLAVFQLPGSNALKTADAIKAKMRELKESFRRSRLRHLLRYDRLRERIDPRGLQDPVRGFHPGVHRGAGLPPGLACHDHSHDRRARVAHWHVRRHGHAGVLAEQPLPVRAGAGDRHCRGRRDRRGGERGTLFGDGPLAARGGAAGDGRGFRAGDCHCPGALRGLCADRAHGRHQRGVLPAVRPDDRRLDDHFGVQLADAQPGPLRDPLQGTRSGPRDRRESHAKKEAMPRLGIVLIIALLAYFMLTPHLAHLLGVQLPGAHGEEASAGHSSAAALWGVRLVCGAAGAAVGWFLAGLVNRALGAFFAAFNWVFDRAINAYGRTVAVLLRVSIIALLVYGGLMGLTYLGFQAVPVGFIPDQDKGYLVVNAQLPDGASLDRSDKIIKQMSAIARDAEKVPGVWHTIDLPGYSALLSTNISNVGGMFVILEPFEERKGDPQRSATAIAAKLRQQYRDIRGARIAVFGAPAIDGLGTTGGFKLQVQDQRGAGLRALQGAVRNLADQGNADPRLVGLFSSFTVNQPQLYVEIDRDKLKSQKVSLNDVNLALQAYLGGLYVNDVTLFNRNWQVNVQADARYRMRVEDIGRLEVRNADGQRVPLRTLVHIKDTSGPAIVNHYNIYPSAEVTGNMAPGTSSGQAIGIMDQLSKEALPSTMGAQWTELTLPADHRRPGHPSPSWPSRWPWSSCSWCCPRNMRAGPCPCRSF